MLLRISSLKRIYSVEERLLSEYQYHTDSASVSQLAITPNPMNPAFNQH